MGKIRINKYIIGAILTPTILFNIVSESIAFAQTDLDREQYFFNEISHEIPSGKYLYKYILFKDGTYGFSFEYPSILGDLEQCNPQYGNASQYFLYIDDMEMQVIFSALLGGANRLNYDYSSLKRPDPYKKIIKDDLWKNVYHIVYIDNSRSTMNGTVYINKFYYGERMHQGIEIRYPEKYLNDKDYQRTIDTIISKFKHSKTIL